MKPSMTQRAPTAADILVVDDEEPNLEALQRILEIGGYTTLRMTSDPYSVPALIAERTPDLLLLDLHMPGRDGFDLLEDLQSEIMDTSGFPVLVLTGDPTPATTRRALELGARDFLVKPFDRGELLLRMRNVVETHFLRKALETQNSVLESMVASRTRELERSRTEILGRLADVGEFRDGDTGRHTQRVGTLAARLAAVLGMDDAYSKIVRQTAPLHDIGKIGVPDRVLHKPGPLTPEEFEIMKSHTIVGARMLSRGDSELLQFAERIALSHHERWDGGGYPQGLSGASIPLEARLVAVADVFDALTHERPYRSAFPTSDAINYMREQSGAHFDPDVVAAIVALQASLPGSDWLGSFSSLPHLAH
jgi:putative two-component system response regulator